MSAIANKWVTAIVVGLCTAWLTSVVHADEAEAHYRKALAHKRSGEFDKALIETSSRRDIKTRKIKGNML